MAHRHCWLVEPCLQSKPSAFKDGEIDGELYTARCTRGNLRSECKGCGAQRRFHPFTGRAVLSGSIAPVFDLMLAVKPELVLATIA